MNFLQILQKGIGLLKKPKVFIPLIVIIVGLIIWNRVFASSSAPQYQTATAQTGTLITSISDSGNITAAGSVTITTSAAGVVSAVYVKQGDIVTQGEKIADITPDQTSQQRESNAYANYLSAQNNLNAAQSKMDSLQSALFKANQAFVTDRGVANPTDQQKADPVYIEEQANWLQAQADYTNQQGVIAQAQANVSSAWYAYQQTASEITAPASGVITNLAIAPGLGITGGDSTSSNSNTTATETVGTITVNNGQVQATVNLSEIDVTKVKVGQKATLTLDAFPNETFTGKVAAIDTNGVQSSGVTNYPVTITLDNTESNIYPNMSVTAKIITAIKDNVLLIPTAAIQTQAGQSTVRVLKNGQVQTVSVTTGDSNDTETEITSGLQDGDTVVTSVINPVSSTGSTGTSPFSAGGFGGGVRVFSGGGGFGGGARRGN